MVNNFDFNKQPDLWLAVETLNKGDLLAGSAYGNTAAYIKQRYNKPNVIDIGVNIVVNCGGNPNSGNYLKFDVNTNLKSLLHNYLISLGLTDEQIYAPSSLFDGEFEANMLFNVGTDYLTSNFSFGGDNELFNNWRGKLLTFRGMLESTTFSYNIGNIIQTFQYRVLVKNLHFYYN